MSDMISMAAGGRIKDGILHCKIVSDDKGNLLAQFDNTTVMCKFLEAPPIDSHIGISQYNQIVNSDITNGRYIEVSDYSVLHLANAPVMETGLTTNRPKKTVNVRGVIVCVSPVKRIGSMIYFICLKEEEQLFSLAITTPSLLHLSQYLSVGDRVYNFTELRVSLLNKGRMNEKKILASTDNTLCLPETVLYHPVFSLQEYGSNLISYSGMITQCLCPEGGVFELDQSVKLMINKDAIDLGLRDGSVVVLDNVHIVNEDYWKGFYCCIVSCLRVTAFSNDNSSLYQPLLASKNRLLKFVSSYAPLDRLWLINAFCVLKDSLRGIATGRVMLQVLENLVQILLINPVQTDDITSFFSYPHDCNFETTSYCNSHLLTPSSLHTQFSRQSVATGASTQSPSLSWTYTTEDNKNNVLIGYLTCDSETGQVVLKDLKKSIHIISHHSSLLHHWNQLLIITQYQFIRELMTVYKSDSSTVYTCSYIRPVEFESVDPASQDSSTALYSFYFVLQRKCRLMSATYEVDVVGNVNIDALYAQLADNQRRRQRVILKLLNIQQYALLKYGHIYHLAASKLVQFPVYTLTDGDSIKMFEAISTKCESSPFMSITAILSSAEQKRDSLVSFSGCITKRYYCISKRFGEARKRKRTATSSFIDTSETLKSPEINDHYTLTLKIKGGLDTLNVYIQLKDTPLPLGLLPGTFITCHYFELKLSSSGNPYCIQSAISSIDIAKEGAVQQQSVASSPVMIASLIYQLNDLSLRNAVTVEGHITSVQFVSLQYICKHCNTVLTGSYHGNCKLPHIVFEASARLILEDGTGEAHLYCENSQVPEMLKISNEKWQKLQFSVQSKGSVVYIKHKFNIPTDPDNSTELERLVSRSCVYRYIQANVCPFVSKSQQLIKDKEGYRQWTFRVHGQEYTTKSYIKLQLNLLSIIPVNISNICHSLISQL